MDHSKISWNASDEIEVIDTFLSLPKPKNKPFSKLAKILWRFVDGLASFCRCLEPREIDLNERILEVPFVLQRLPKSGRILDVGCSNSALALQLACMNYEVTGIDVRSYPFKHPNLEFIQKDISCNSMEEECYDCAILMSTIEHTGFGHYGDSISLNDREFLDIVARHVKTNSSILITVPFGQKFECNWYRVYDSDALEKLIAGYPVITKVFARRTSLLEWQICSESDLANVASQHFPINGIALLEIKKS